MALSVDGDAFVFACGPWLPQVFPPSLAVASDRRVRSLSTSARRPATIAFGPAHTPAWIDRPAGIYGIPDLEDGGLKVGIDEHGPPIDPDTDDRLPDRRRDRSRARMGRAAVSGDAGCARRRARASASTKTPRMATS